MLIVSDQAIQLLLTAMLGRPLNSCSNLQKPKEQFKFIDAHSDPQNRSKF